MRVRWLVRLVLGTCALALATLGWAAADGTRGPTSSGSLRISFTVAQPLRISGLSDIGLTAHAGRVSPAGSNLCVTGAANGYQLRAVGNGPDNGFTLSGAQPVAYQVDLLDGSRRMPLNPDAPLHVAHTPSAGAPPTQAECTGHHTQLEVQVQGQPSPTPGTYTGTLTLVVAPD